MWASVKRASPAPSRKRFFRCSPEASLNETPNVTPGHEFLSPSENHEPEPVAPHPPKTVTSPLSIAVASWLVPGLGHFLLGRTGRAIVFFFAVGGQGVAAYSWRGKWSR